VVVEEEQGRRAHVAIGVVQHLLDARQHPEIAGGVEELEGAAANRGRLVLQEVADPGVRLRPLRRAEDVERVEHLFGIRRRELGREDVGGRPVEHRRQLSLGVETPPAEAVEQRARVPPARHDGGHDPAADEHDVDQRHLPRRPVELVGEDRQSESGEPVAQTPDERVDRGLRLELDLGRDGQVEQLHRRLVERVPHDRVSALEQMAAATVPSIQTANSLPRRPRGTMRRAGPRPKRRRNRDVTRSWSARQAMPAQKLNCAKNAVRAFLSGYAAFAIALNCQPAKQVAIEDSVMSDAIEMR
jgi:hypothetical protein